MENRQTAGPSTGSGTETQKHTGPIVLVIIRDCHAKHNIVVKADTPDEERAYRRIAKKEGYLVAVRKPKEPTCDNCANMSMLNWSDGSAHRHCDLMGLYIPDTEQSPTCNFHMAVSKFETMLTAKARKGGEA